MTHPSPPTQTEGEPPVDSGAWRLALYAFAASLVALLEALGLVGPDVTPHVLSVVQTGVALVALGVAAWTNPAARRLRAGRHARE